MGKYVIVFKNGHKMGVSVKDPNLFLTELYANFDKCDGDQIFIGDGFAVNVSEVCAVHPVDDDLSVMH